MNCKVAVAKVMAVLLLSMPVVSWGQVVVDPGPRDLLLGDRRPPNTTPNPDQGNESRSDTGMILGTSLLGAVLLGTLAYYWWHHRHTRKVKTYGGDEPSMTKFVEDNGAVPATN
ncbi:MAG: hypothetical protein KC474_10765 [Cyanobacteria bacterium HKST-UBA04]|nr:hypothetical protein [Cyanobacteria bacterium HKST-UBA04]MCA9840616.1 hypothetical protein [Cyanobacteria bacterium HKST-UBA03]